MNLARRANALAYLRKHNVMTLATSGPEGLWSAAVFYVNDDFNLYFTSSPTTRHCRNIAAHPEVAVTIQEDYRDWRQIKGIQLEGLARRLEGEQRAAAFARFGIKFPYVRNPDSVSEQIASALGKSAWFQVAPSRFYFIDNALGLGHRDEIDLAFEPGAAGTE